MLILCPFWRSLESKTNQTELLLGEKNTDEKNLIFCFILKAQW